MNNGNDHGALLREVASGQAAASQTATALFDSRQRWRDLVMLVAELAFETDGEGRVMFAVPEQGFSLRGADLLGTEAVALFAEPPPAVAEALCGRAGVWRGRVWMHRPDGTQAACLLSVAALTDADGAPAGARAVVVDIGAEEAREAARAAALRQAETVRRLLAAVIELPPGQTGIDVALAMLRQEIGADAIEILPVGASDDLLAPLASVGTAPASGGHMLIHRLEHRGAREGLRSALLRARRVSAPFSLESRGLVRALAPSLCAMLEREALAQANRAAALIDTVTGFWTMGSFAEEIGRRFDRLDVEGAPGTLMLLGFGGHAIAATLDDIAASLADELRDAVRPTDLLGRLHDDIIALWCDGMDHLTGAERAARFCARMPALLPGGAPVSTGLVTRWPGSGDDGPAIIGRATEALAQADEAGGGTWRVWKTA